MKDSCKGFIVFLVFGSLLHATIFLEESKETYTTRSIGRSPEHR